MSLNDLRPFVGEQNEAIAAASSGFTLCDDPYWTTFRNHVWGDDKELFQEMKSVERDEVDPVADVQLPSNHLVAVVPPVARSFFNLESSKFLVRSEYEAAERAAVLSCKTFTKVFVVGGTPGIGKTAFIFWLLMRRLARRLPTVFHAHPSKALLFDDNGVWEFSALDRGPYHPLYTEPGAWSQRIWALVDLGSEEPAGFFRRSPPFFIVNTVSPRSNQLEWLKKHPIEYFYMDRWSDSEVLQARPLLTDKFTERQIWHLHKEFGASLRDISHFADKPFEYENLLRIEVAKAIANRLPPYHLSHFIMTTGPRPDNRGLESKEFTSRRVFEMLCERDAENRLDPMSALYDRFQHHAISATGASTT